ncbi:MAG: ABC transporter substrate-binding protein [Chloroflexi bacterium]|nr:ABC transporter substrate-binding protein [Chloroflexota bacterium]
MATRVHFLKATRLLLPLALLAAAACAKEAPATPTPSPTSVVAATPTPPSTPTPVVATPTPAPTRTPTPAPTPTPALSGRITIALDEEPGSLDGQTTSGNSLNLMTIYNIYETFLRQDTEGKLVPYMAESWSTVDAKTYRFKLRSGITFSDGTVFNAGAAKATWDFIKRPESRVGGSARYAGITEFRVVDDMTVDILHKGDITIPFSMSYHFQLASAKQILENPASKETAPIASGPYKVDNWRKGVAVTFKARPDYWGNKVMGAPTIAEVRYITRIEPGVKVATLRVGEADLAPGIPADLATILPANMVVNTPGIEMYTLRFGFNDPLTKDLRLRQAVSLAINRDDLVKVYAGFAKPPMGNQLWPEGVSGWASRPVIKQDLAQARNLLQAAGATGKSAELVWPTHLPQMGDVAKVVAANLTTIGLTVTTKQITGAEYRTVVREKTNPPPFVFRSFGHEEGLSEVNFRKGWMCGGDQSVYCNPEQDAAAEQALAEFDPAKRTQLIQRMADILERELPLIALVNPGLVYGKSAKLTLPLLPNHLLPVADMRLTQ